MTTQRTDVVMDALTSASLIVPMACTCGNSGHCAACMAADQIEAAIAEHGKRAEHVAGLLETCKALLEDLLPRDKDAAKFASVMAARAAIAKATGNE